MNYTYKIAGEELPSPAIDGFAISSTDLDNADGTGLNEKATAVRKKIRTGRRSISVTWDMLTPEQIKQIDRLTKKGNWFDLEYFDAFDNSIVTRTLYRDTLTYTMKALVSDTEAYYTLTTTFTER